MPDFTACRNPGCGKNSHGEEYCKECEIDSTEKENPNETLITLDEFVQEVKTTTLLFQFSWFKNNSKDPANYPMRLTKGDWDEQFNSWCQQRED